MATLKTKIKIRRDTNWGANATLDSGEFGLQLPLSTSSMPVIKIGTSDNILWSDAPSIALNGHLYVGSVANKLIVTGNNGKLLAGSVAASSLAPGTTPTVNISNNVVTFGIPKGAKGDKGDTGSVGPQGPQGDTGPQGETGPQGNVGPQGPQGETGPAGANGVSAGFGTPTASITNSTGTPEVTITASGPNTAKVFNFAFSGLKGETGGQGPQGNPGNPGVGISSVEQTTTASSDGGSNVIKVTKTDGTSSTFTVKNGSKGSQGPAGPEGPQGQPGPQGPQGYSVGSLVCVSGNNSTTTATPSTADNATSYYRIKDTNGNFISGTIAVKNGSKGSTGATGVVSIDSTGTGNAITSLSYDSTNKKITATKGTTFLTSGDVSESADGGKIVKRDSAGHIRANYVYSTWLLTTGATATASTNVNYAVIDGNGWVYKKTADQMKTALDIGKVKIGNTYYTATLSGTTLTFS